MDNRGSVHLSKKAFLIIAGTVLGIILIAWVLLITGIFKKDKKPQKNVFPETKTVRYDLPEIPDGYELVFRETGYYRLYENGKKTYLKKMTYDDAGNCLTETEFEEDGKTVKSFIESEYDEENREIKRTEYNENRSITLQVSRKYDSDGRMTESVENIRRYYDDGDLINSRTEQNLYRYDGRGQKRKQETTVTGSIYSNMEQYSFVSEWDEEGRPLTEGIKEGEEYILYRYQYDAFGNMVVKEYRTAAFDEAEYYVLEKAEYSADGKRMIRLVEYYDPELYPEDWKRCLFDENGNLVRMTEYKDGEKTKETEYLYDSEGRVLSTVTDSGESKLEIVYTYDTAGNLLKTVTTEDGKVIMETVVTNGEEHTKGYEYTENGERYIRQETIESKSIHREIYYDENGGVSADRTVEYDGDENVTKILRYKDGNFDYWYEYSDYKPVEALSGKTLYKPQKTIIRNEDGTVQYTVEQQYYEKGKAFISRIVYKADGTRDEGETGYYSDLDEYDNLIRETCYNYDGKGTVSVYEHEYQPFAVKKNQDIE